MKGGEYMNIEIEPRAQQAFEDLTGSILDLSLSTKESEILKLILNQLSLESKKDGFSEAVEIENKFMLEREGEVLEYL